MKVHYFITIKGKIESKKLYEIISQFGANITDIETECLVYGECYMAQVSQIVYHCALFGNISAEITH